MADTPMTLPPLMNVFAFRSFDDSLLDAMDKKLRGSGEFKDVSTPGPGWVLGRAPLPGSPTSNGSDVRTYFVEGAAEPGLEAIGESSLRDPARVDRFPGDFGFLHFGSNGNCSVV